MHRALLAAVALLLRPTTAVFADEAFKTDYHFALLGLPKEDATFFRPPNPKESPATLIYTLSEEHVLGAVHPRDGSIVWRQQLLPTTSTSNASFLRAGEGQNITISGIGNHVAAWSAADGKLWWNYDLPGQIEDLEILELNNARETPSAKDAIVLSSGQHSGIHLLNGTSGALRWTHSIDSGDIPYQVSASDTEIFGILLHKTLLGSLKIKVIALDPVTGHKNDEYMLSSDSELAAADTIVAVGANSASPIIAWTDSAHSVLKVNILGNKAVSSFNIDKHDGHVVNRVRLHAPQHTNSLAHFLVHFQTDVSHWGEVFHVDLKKNQIHKAYDLPKLGGRGVFTTASSNANVYFTRITADQVTTVSSVSHGILKKWPLNGFKVAAGKDEEVEPIHAATEIMANKNGLSAVRSAILLSTGNWILIKDDEPVWQRPELLARTVSATFALPAEVEAFAHELEIESHSNPVQAYIHRVKRHVQDLLRLPQTIAALPRRIQNGLFGTTAESGLTGDVFGFHQVIVCAAKIGRVVALDAGNPYNILWSRQAIPLKPGEVWDPTFTSVSDGVVVIGFGADTTELKLNASTGSDASISTNVDSRPTLPGSIQYTLRNGELEAVKSGSAATGALWHFAPSEGEKIVSLVPRPVDDPVASIGKVLGDRKVLYKYLNPNSALLVTANDATQSASFYVLDTTSGAILSATVHNGVDLSAPIPSIMSENWFAYSYTADSSEELPKGSYLVVGELFESLVPNDRGPLSGQTNASALHMPPQPFVLQKSYQIPEPISKLAVTRTRQGITSRQLLAVLADSSSIVGIPYGVLDPRRPVGRDPTKDEQSEGLIRYTATIEFDPKWFLNHKREVVGIENIVTSPALIESTSLVFAYGLDVFGTKLSPSFSFDILGKDFNKFQMLATVAALAMATFIVGPLVTRKQVNTRWQFA